MSEMPSCQVVTFRVGDDEFAADIMAVERVLRYVEPTTVPHLPEWVEGVLEYEGRVIPVIDLARRFEIVRESGGGDDAGGMTRRVIVFAVGDDWIGAVVDAVLEVVVIAGDRISPPPALFRGLSAEYLRGLVRRVDAPRGAATAAPGGSLVIFLEVQRLLSATERLVLERVRSEGRDSLGVDDARAPKVAARPERERNA